MDINNLKANWLQLKGRIKEEYGDLTDNDLMEIEGRLDVLIGKLQERYDISYEEAQKRANRILLVANRAQTSNQSDILGEGDIEAGRRFQKAQHEFAEENTDLDNNLRASSSNANSTYTNR